MSWLKMLPIFGFLLLSLVFSQGIEAQQGCCSHHDGISHCDSTSGRYVCNDGTYSPSCTCARSTYRAPVVTIPTSVPLELSATWTFVPQENGTFLVDFKLTDPNPSRYSAVVGTVQGADPGNQVDFASTQMYFNNVRTGRKYINLKKDVNGYWSSVINWTIDVPKWVPTPTPTYTPTPTLTPKPTIAPTLRPTIVKVDLLGTISAARGPTETPVLGLETSSDSLNPLSAFFLYLARLFK